MAEVTPGNADARKDWLVLGVIGLRFDFGRWKVKGSGLGFNGIIGFSLDWLVLGVIGLCFDVRRLMAGLGFRVER